MEDCLSLSDSSSFSGFSAEDVENTAPPKSVVKKVNKAKGKGPAKTKAGNKPSGSKGKKGSASSEQPLADFDVTKLSQKDIESLRTVLGIVPHPQSQPSGSFLYEASAADDDVSLGTPLHELPNIHVEVDSADISDSENYLNLNKNLENALFGDSIDGPEGAEVWDLPKLRAPEKGSAVADSLAKLVNLACTHPCDTDTLVSRYKVPENCSNMCSPSVNQEIWKTLDKFAHAQDKAMVDIQNLVAAGMGPIIRLTEVLKAHITSIPEAKTLISDALTVLGQVQYNLSIRRRYLIRPALKRKYQGLCHISMPITEKLFGDDISKDIKNCDNMAFLTKEPSTFRGGFKSRGSRLPRKGYYSNSGSYQTQRFQPYPHRGQSNYRMFSARSRPVKRMASATASAPNEQA